MAYTSGRTVKSAVTRVTTVASATRDARKLADKYLPGLPDVAITSGKSADPVTLAPRVRTTISWPGRVTAAHIQLGAAITELPGYLSARNDDCSITYLRSA